MSSGDGTAACPDCGAAVRSQARFCGSCGTPLAAGAQSLPDRSDVRRAMGAVGIVYFGVLAVLIAAGELLPITETGLGAAGQQALLCLGFLVVGLFAGYCTGHGALRASLAGSATPRDMSLGALLGTAVLVVNVTWLTGFAVLAGEGTWSLDLGVPEELLPALLATAVLPALFEEWLSRGLLWTALERLTDERTTIFLTAALFAMLHGLNGEQIWELPSRFVMGLVLGWLRARSGSLGPGIGAHFVNNALACFLLE